MSKKYPLMNVTDIDPRFAETQYVVEVDDGGSHRLWSSYSHHGSDDVRDEAKSWRDPNPRYEWIQESDGVLYQVGAFGPKKDVMPVTVSFFWYIIDGVRVLFYHPCSMVVHHDIVEQWLKLCCNPQWRGRRAHCDEESFHHCLHMIDDHKGAIADDLKIIEGAVND